MFSFFKSDPLKKLNAQYNDLLKKALDAQRRGDIKSYSALTSEAEDIASKIDELKEN